jgi:hypothetical protein
MIVPPVFSTQEVSQSALHKNSPSFQEVIKGKEYLDDFANARFQELKDKKNPY